MHFISNAMKWRWIYWLVGFGGRLVFLAVGGVLKMWAYSGLLWKYSCKFSVEKNMCLDIYSNIYHNFIRYEDANLLWWIHSDSNRFAWIIQRIRQYWGPLFGPKCYVAPFWLGDPDPFHSWHTFLKRLLSTPRLVRFVWSNTVRTANIHGNQSRRMNPTN